MRGPLKDEPVAPPWIKGLIVQTDDANVAIRAILSRAGIAYDGSDGAVTTRVDDLVLRFQPMTA